MKPTRLELMQLYNDVKLELNTLLTRMQDQGLCPKCLRFTINRETGACFNCAKPKVEVEKWTGQR